jgi:hypothetical protein
MANPTTNYGFVLPTATDLVTDLPADFDVALQGVDTRLKALQPGTTLGDIAYSSATANTNTRLGIGTAGQVLTVASGVPAWATPTTGDIEGVTAGTGISGGGTSGTVTVTNSMATAYTTKGDLVPATGSAAFARLGVGANDTILTADSTAATGMKWAAAASASGPAFQAYSTPTQSISSTTNTKATMTNENFDTDNNFASSRFTPTKAGYYLITGSISFTGAANKTFRVLLYKNGSSYSNWNTVSLGVAVANPTIMNEALIYCNGSTDYVEMYGWTDATSPEFYFSSMQGVWIRS